MQHYLNYKVGYSRFLANTGAAWKTGFSHQVMSQGRSKMELFSGKFLSVLMTSLDGKTSFPWSACVCQKPGIANLLI